MSGAEKLAEEAASGSALSAGGGKHFGRALGHGRVVGTHGLEDVRTRIHSGHVGGDGFLGLSPPRLALLGAWLVYLAAALSLEPAAAWRLAALTAVCIGGHVLVRTGAWSSFTAAYNRGCSGMVRWAVMGVLLLVAAVVIVMQIVAGGEYRASRLQALAGTAVFMGLSVALSSNMEGIPWAQVTAGFLLQFFLGCLVMKSEAGMHFFEEVGTAVSDFLELSDVGKELVFGANFEEHLVAFKILPTVFFFSAFISVMYYLGVMQATVRVVAVALKMTVGSSLVQSVNAAGNLFLGQTEAPLLIRPFLDKASPSDIHCVMVGGFASVSGTVLAAYIGMGISPTELLAASVMSVPGTLFVSNLVCPPGSMPEDDPSAQALEQAEGSSSDGEESAEEEPDAGDHFEFPPVVENNIIEAAGNGAHTAIDLVLNIGAMLLAFRSLIAAVDMALGYLGGLVRTPELSFALICSYAFWPLAWLLGTPVEDCSLVARLIGTKVFINEFVAYSELGGLIDEDGHGGGISRRGQLVATYALCGFSNVGSVGVQLGCLSSLCPGRSKVFAKLVVSAMITGNVVCFLTATFAMLLA